MSARVAPLALLLLLSVFGTASSETDMNGASPDQDGHRCRAFVQASLDYQRELAERVKQLHGRRVYLFDASGFTADFVEERSPDGVRYKSGVLAGGLRADAVLSVSAQRALGEGPEAARTYLRWTRREQDTLADDNGVFV
ncbi:Ribosome-recycling factor [Frankliniella fusca]|uniref:Ribosome-recycling factor n=1 Tax=Frankliniella fusca TaxID=407009 RepID=A0AAE1GYX3_9NEOP|nr:Ribosome-recycling factor [Frankliniella fusca]